EHTSRTGWIDQLAREPVAEIVHHGDAVAVAAHDVVQAIDLAEMRQAVEGEADLAAPGMADPIAVELRERRDHSAIEHCGGLLRRHVEGRGAAAVKEAIAIRRAAEIGQ